MDDGRWTRENRAAKACPERSRMGKGTSDDSDFHFRLLLEIIAIYFLRRTSMYNPVLFIKSYLPMPSRFKYNRFYDSQNSRHTSHDSFT
jgi:hypothetical protein